MPMIDLRVHRFDNNLYGGNVGIAARYVPKPNSFCDLLGFNAFYDFRQGFKGFYNQVGVGLEALGRRLDFRANAYFPIGVTKHNTTCVFDDFEGDFFAIERDCEFTSYGFNAEVGYLAIDAFQHDFLFIWLQAPTIWPAAAMTKCSGGEIRVRPQYKDYVALDLKYSYDTTFRSVFQAEIIFYLPLYKIRSRPNRRAPCGISDRQVYQPIERFEVMPLGRKTCWQRNF